MSQIIKPKLPIIDYSNPITKGLVFEDPMYEGAGTKSIDDILSDPLGTITGSGATWDKHLYGIDLDFSAAASNVVYVSPAAVNTLARFSVEFLFYNRSAGGSSSGKVLYKGTSLTLPYFWCGTGTAGHMRLQVGYGTTAGFWDVSINTNQWYHYVVTYTMGNVNNVPTVYLNGINTSFVQTQTPVGTTPSDDTGLYVGNRQDGLRNFDGKIVYVRIWNRLLAAAEARQLFMNPWGICKQNKPRMFSAYN